MNLLAWLRRRPSPEVERALETAAEASRVTDDANSAVSAYWRVFNRRIRDDYVLAEAQRRRADRR